MLLGLKCKAIRNEFIFIRIVETEETIFNGLPGMVGNFNELLVIETKLHNLRFDGYQFFIHAVIYELYI